MLNPIFGPTNMKLKALFIFVSILIAFIKVSGQPGKVQPIRERVIATTDRSLYVAGENILFSACLLNSEENTSNANHSVLYCELITPAGYRVAGGKFLVEKGKSEGCIVIPNEIITGYYYLRAYTKLMRNYGPGTYYYILLKIVNPSKSEVISGVIPAKISDSVHQATFNANRQLEIELSVDKTVYATRDTVHVSLIDKSGDTQNYRDLNLSVIPDGAFQHYAVQPMERNLAESQEISYPKEKGISLTGKLIDANSSKPLPSVWVNLSIIGIGRDFMATRTDSAGRFYFSLPAYSGSRDLFICSENLAGIITRILVDNDFCTAFVSLASPAFSLTEPEREVAFNLVVNRQVNEAFTRDTSSIQEVSQPLDQPFYGTPSAILYLDQYLQLPTLEECFNELPGMVKVRKRKGEKYFKVFGQQGELELYDPLVMVDMVAVDDPNKVLAVLPQNVARIEVVNEPYVKGSQKYGGIVSIISKRNDFAGIDLPSSGIFINYQFFSENEKCQVPGQIHPSLPDARNTLLWQPHLIVANHNKTDVAFTTPDTAGKYRVVLSGVLKDGETVIKEAAFEVKSQ
jgi:hypothetical protein